MSKRIFLFLFLMMTAHVAKAQLLWIQGGFDILSITQTGTLFVIDTASPTSYATPAAVERSLTHGGLVIEGFYPINFGKPSYETFATGPVFGFSLTNGRRKLSTDPAYLPKPEKFFNNGTGNFRVPVLWSIRTGNMVDAEKSPLGFEGAFGIQMMHINTADEIGWAILPALRGAVQYKRVSMTLNYFPMKYVSYYRTDDGDIKRLTNKIFSIEFKYAFDWYLGRVD